MNREERRRKERISRIRQKQTRNNKVNKHNIADIPIPDEKLGPPGIESELHLVLSKIKDKTEDNKKLTDSTPREFEIILFFSKHYIYSKKLDMSDKPELGSSFLKFEQNAISLKIQTATLSFDIAMNSSREASSAKATVTAASRREALAHFINAITPAFDHLSYVSNRPFLHDKIIIKDKKNEIISMDYINPYQDFTVNSAFEIIPEELRSIYSIYREAKNTVSPFYKTLCYMKIIEGILKSIKPQIRKKAKELSIELPKHKEVVPNDSELLQFSPQYIGKGIVDLFDNEFQKLYRNAVAHFALDDKPPVNLSNYFERAQFASKVHLFELCVRVLIENVNKDIAILKN